MSRRKLPYMRMYWQDYTDDTGHLTYSEHGAYMLIIRAYWQRQKAPTEAEARGASLMPADVWVEARDTLAAFFKIGRNGQWKHARIEEELKRTRRVSEANSQSGKAGGKASGQSRRRSENEANASANAKLQHITGEPTAACPRPASERRSRPQFKSGPPVSDEHRAKSAALHDETDRIMAEKAFDNVTPIRSGTGGAS